MPGRKLSHKEKKLLELWNNPGVDAPRPTLRSIEIGGGSGLRGIDGLKVTFRYPITAICGNNGTGKSTVLALVALAHHSPPGWFAYLGNTEPLVSGGDRSYYTFSTFFLTGQGEAPPKDVSITWRYDEHGSETSRTFEKKGNRWGRYDTRPQREVHYLPMGRVLPASELSSIRSTFRSPAGTVTSAMLNSESLGHLRFIMGKPYSKAEVQKAGKYKFPRCTSNVPYTAFNMGGGESCMILLLHLLHQLPAGGLMVVEEIEAGLHPQAQKRLAEKLVDICKKKNLQFICSTHSGVFLDSLPREARLLLKQSGAEHTALESLSTRHAMYEMTGEAHPEVVLYCEDGVAAIMIEESLPQDLRIRVRIQEIGSNTAIIHQGVSHVRSGFEMRYLCVVDGDCSDSEIEGWMEEERGSRDDIVVKYIKLPGDNLPPEKWALSQLRHPPYKGKFADQLNCTVADAQAHIDALDVLPDHHRVPFTLHQRTNLEESECTRRIMQSFARQHPQLDALRQEVKTMLG